MILNSKEIANKIINYMIKEKGNNISDDDVCTYICNEIQDIRNTIASDVYYTINIRNDIQLED